MIKTNKVLVATVFGLALLFFQKEEIWALDFSILNRGNIIFQEILIETDQADTDYYYNFGITGLEPGARHNIHISTTEELIFCSFYLFGISNENYVIENVAIEEHSIVYILPEHYKEDMDNYHDVDNPDAVYGADFFERTEFAFVDEESPENQFKTELELFNYTNFPIFRIFCRDIHSDNSDIKEGRDLNLLPEGKVLSPQESLTLELVLEPDITYEMILKSSEDLEFVKQLDSGLDNDFLVFYDSDRVKEWENRPLMFKNSTLEELKEIYLMDQESGNRVEVLNGSILGSGGEKEYLLTENITRADIIIKTASNSKIYIFDWDFSQNSYVEIQGD